MLTPLKWKIIFDQKTLDFNLKIYVLKSTPVSFESTVENGNIHKYGLHNIL